jgi:hypothetical protein
MTQHRPGFAPVFSAFATIVAGVAMAVQGTANGTLGEILGNGIFAATVSFLVGLVFLTVLSLSLPGARRGLAKAYRIVRTGEFPWWMTLGGLAGTLASPCSRWRTSPASCSAPSASTARGCRPAGRSLRPRGGSADP